MSFIDILDEMKTVPFSFINKLLAYVIDLAKLIIFAPNGQIKQLKITLKEK